VRGGGGGGPAGREFLWAINFESRDNNPKKKMLGPDYSWGESKTLPRKPRTKWKKRSITAVKTVGSGRGILKRTREGSCKDK